MLLNSVQVERGAVSVRELRDDAQGGGVDEAPVVGAGLRRWFGHGHLSVVRARCRGTVQE